MNKPLMHSKDMTADNVSKIAALFPNCVTEHKDDEGNVVLGIDFEKLQQELSSDLISTGEERYQFTWPGKMAAIREANRPTNCALRPDLDSSEDFWNTQNLYIEGDNLEVLKLLQENYLGKVKMIYIDPPYNTGNEFVYNDSFSESTSEFSEKAGMFDEEGNMLLQNYEKNSESNGRFHTDWLNMIYPRLKVARNLLADDGVIFISIDDGELDNLRKVCNEIFGASNFIADVCVVNNLKGRNDKKYIARANERLLMYVKSKEFEEYGLSLSNDTLKEYKEQDENGKYRLLELRKRGGADTRAERPNMYYPFYVNPETGHVSLEQDLIHTDIAIPVKSNGVDGRWRWGIETAKKNLEYLYGKKAQGTDKYNIYEKDYLEGDDGCRRIKPKSVMTGASYSTDGATKEYRALMGNIDFSSPKPISMMEDLIEYSTSPDEDFLIMDFFSGSSTTAHAVMRLNAKDNGKRHFIMVQLPELTDNESAAYKEGYKNLCQIAEERIRRAGAKIVSDNGLNKSDLDTGFRVLKLDSSNMKDVYYTPNDTQNADLFDTVSNIKMDRTSMDLLFQVMLEKDIPLSAKIEQKEMSGKTVFFVEDNYLVATFDDNITEDLVKEIAKAQPYNFVMANTGFASDSLVDNFEQIFKAYSPETACDIL